MTAPNAEDLMDAAAANANAAAAAMASRALPPLDPNTEARRYGATAARPPSRAIAAQLAASPQIEMPPISLYADQTVSVTLKRNPVLD